MNTLIFAKLKAFSIHFLITLAIAGSAGMLIFNVWYADGIAEYVGGSELYGLILLVELGIGPLISFVIYNPSKPRKELFRDYCVVATIQFVALFYGLNVVAQSRPIYTVFVKDRIEVVAAIEIDDSDYEHASHERFLNPTWYGSERICVEFPTDIQERNDLLFSAVGGRDIQFFPKYYRECEKNEYLDKALLSSQLEEIVEFKGIDVSLPSGRYTWLPVTHRFGAFVEIYPEGEMEHAYYLGVDPF